MSIVEKALSKSRAGRPSDPGRPESSTDPYSPRIALAQRTEVADAEDTPARSIELDTAALRAEGLLASEEYSARVRHDIRRVKWPILDVALRRSAVELERGNLIMVASALPGEGKTFTAMNLALSIAAERDCTVLLVDADLARPKLTRALGLQNERGLFDLLVQGDLGLRDVTFGTSVPRLRVVPAGQARADASVNGPELVRGQEMARITAELAARPMNHVTIFDSPPLLATDEGQVLSRLVGQVVMVVKASATPRSAVKEAVDLVSRTASIGLVLNQSQQVFGPRYYGDYYEYANS